MDVILNISGFVILYLIAGILIFLSIWKEVERDSDIMTLPRKRRICIRIAAILTWPWTFMAFIYVCFIRLIGWFWKSLTE